MVDEAATTRYRVRFSDGTELTFNTLAELQQFGSDLDTDPGMARVLAIRWWIARSNDATNTAIIVGKTLTFDLSNNNPIRVQ